MAAAAVESYRDHYRTTLIQAATFLDYLEDGQKKFRLRGDGKKLIWPDTNRPPAITFFMDDLWTTGSTYERCRGLINNIHPDALQGVGVLVNRSMQIPDVTNFSSLKHIKAEDFAQADCPFCAAKRPMVTKLGHGKDFQKQNPSYPGGFI